MPAVTDTVISGPYLLAALLALCAGAVSFASPCVIPLVPGYLSYLTSLVGAEAAVPMAGPGVPFVPPAPGAPERGSIVAGWYPDPAGSTQTRWWDGVGWTDHLR